MGLLAVGGYSQSNEAYSDEDLKTYIAISNEMNRYRFEVKAKADSMREATGLSEPVMVEIIDKVKHQPYDSVKELYNDETIKAFEKTMAYRQFLRKQLKQKLQLSLQKVNWELDFYEHLALSIEAIPELQQRMIRLSK